MQFLDVSGRAELDQQANLISLSCQSDGKLASLPSETRWLAWSLQRLPLHGKGQVKGRTCQCVVCQAGSGQDSHQCRCWSAFVSNQKCCWNVRVSIQLQQHPTASHYSTCTSVASPHTHTRRFTNTYTANTSAPAARTSAILRCSRVPYLSSVRRMAPTSSTTCSTFLQVHTRVPHSRHRGQPAVC